jgi:arsenate reductase
MAEGWARHLLANQVEPYSAGIVAKGLNPHAVKVMAEVGIDISQQQSQAIEDIENVEPDHVITVCANADQNCPVFPGKTQVTHVGFDDPPVLAKNSATQEETLEHYRRVRDEIGEFVKDIPERILG